MGARLTVPTGEAVKQFRVWCIVLLLAPSGLLVAQETKPKTQRADPARSSTPNLDALSEEGKALQQTATFHATNPDGKVAFDLDYTMSIFPKQYYEYKYLFMMSGGDIYSLRSQTEADTGHGKVVLQLPDHSTVTLQYTKADEATITYGKLQAILDVSQSHKEQFKNSDVQGIRSALPESGKALVEVIGHLRGGLCREASLCGGTADVVLDLFRGDSVASEVDAETSDDSGWKLRSLSEGKVVGSTEQSH
jgi:hypothetical protein